MKTSFFPAQQYLEHVHVISVMNFQENPTLRYALKSCNCGIMARSIYCAKNYVKQLKWHQSFNKAKQNRSFLRTFKLFVSQWFARENEEWDKQYAVSLIFCWANRWRCLCSLNLNQVGPTMQKPFQYTHNNGKFMNLYIRLYFEHILRI